MRSSRLLAPLALAYGALVFLPMLGNSFHRDDFAWVERALAAALVAPLLVQAAVMQVVIRRHAAMGRAEGVEPWARLRAVARIHRPASPEAP